MTDQTLTKKQQEILFHLYTFRYLNRYHIQTLLNHKDSARINKWLTNLTQKNYITQIYSKKYGKINKPAIYYLANKSIKILQTNQNVSTERLVKVYKEKGRSNRFIEHCLAIADTYMALKQVTVTEEKELYFYARTELLDHEYLLKPVPDAYIAFEYKKTTKRYFLDVFDEGIPRFAIKKRITDYLNYADTGEWEEATSNPFPKILLVLPTTLARYTAKLITAFTEDQVTNLSFTVITTSQITELHRYL